MDWLDGFFENSWLKLTRYNSTTGALEVNGTEIVVVDTVTDWPSLQAIPKIAGNDNIVLHVTGLGVGGSDWRYKHSLGRWVVIGEPVLKLGYAAVTHGATLTTEEVGFEYQMPNDYGAQNKSIMQNGDILTVAALLTKTGTLDSMRPNLKFGTTAGTTGTSLWAPTPGATTITLGAEITLQRVSATALRLHQINTSVAGNNFTSTTAWQGDVAVSNMDTSTAFYLDFTYKCGTSTGDSAFKIENYSVRLRSGIAG